MVCSWFLKAKLIVLATLKSISRCHEWRIKTISPLLLKDQKELVLFLLVPKNYFMYEDFFFRFEVT